MALFLFFRLHIFSFYTILVNCRFVCLFFEQNCDSSVFIEIFFLIVFIVYRTRIILNVIQFKDNLKWGDYIVSFFFYRSEMWRHKRQFSTLFPSSTLNPTPRSFLLNFFLCYSSVLLFSEHRITTASVVYSDIDFLLWDLSFLLNFSLPQCFLPPSSISMKTHILCN